MINLLPKESIKQIQAGHKNVFLVKTLSIVGSVVIFLALASVGSYIYLINAKQTASNSNNSALINSSYQKAKSEADQISSSISAVESIISQGTSYSKLLLELAKVLPDQTTITNFSVDETSINQPLTLKIFAKTDNDINALKSNLNSSSVFSNYSVVSTSDKQTDVANYPIAITITVNINKSVLR